MFKFSFATKAPIACLEPADGCCHGRHQHQHQQQHQPQDANTAGSFPLSMANSGAQVRIVSLRGGAGMDRRMTEMGLNIGTQIRVLQQEGSGLVVMRGESRFALGGGMAHRVMVMPA